MTSTAFEPQITPKHHFATSVLTYQPGHLNANTPIEQAIRQIIITQLQLILTYQPVAIDGTDPEGIHKLRVGLRRLRTALKLFKPYIQPELHQYLKNNAKQISNGLGAMRDLDVLKINYFKYFKDKNTNLPYEDAWLTVLQTDYNRTRDKVVSLIESDKFSDLLSQAYQLYLSPETYLYSQRLIPARPKTIGELVPSKISKFFDKIQTYKDTLTPRTEYKQYHDLRLEIKKFRYLLEFFPDVLEKKASDKIINMLVDIQDNLGALNDSVTANKMLTTQKQNNNFWPESMNIYHQYRQQEYTDLLAKFYPLWEKLNKQSNIKIIQQELTKLTT